MFNKSYLKSVEEVEDLLVNAIVEKQRLSKKIDATKGRRNQDKLKIYVSELEMLNAYIEQTTSALFRTNMYICERMLENVVDDNWEAAIIAFNDQGKTLNDRLSNYLAEFGGIKEMGDYYFDTKRLFEAYQKTLSYDYQVVENANNNLNVYANKYGYIADEEMLKKCILPPSPEDFSYNWENGVDSQFRIGDQYQVLNVLSPRPITSETIFESNEEYTK